MFCGKAVRLLRSAYRKAGTGMGAPTTAGLVVEEDEIFNYITGGRVNFGITSADKAKGEDQEKSTEKVTDHPSPDDEFYESSGFSPGFMTNITEEFRTILTNPEQCVELFEALVSSH